MVMDMCDAAAAGSRLVPDACCMRKSRTGSDGIGICMCSCSCVVFGAGAGIGMGICICAIAGADTRAMRMMNRFKTSPPFNRGHRTRKKESDEHQRMEQVQSDVVITTQRAVSDSVAHAYGAGLHE